MFVVSLKGCFGVRTSCAVMLLDVGSCEQIVVAY